MLLSVLLILSSVSFCTVSLSVCLGAYKLDLDSLVATFWERAAHPVCRTFSLYKAMSICILVASHFGFERGSVVLISQVPINCLLFHF